METVGLLKMYKCRLHVGLPGEVFVKKETSMVNRLRDVGFTK